MYFIYFIFSVNQLSMGNKSVTPTLNNNDTKIFLALPNVLIKIIDNYVIRQHHYGRHRYHPETV